MTEAGFLLSQRTHQHIAAKIQPKALYQRLKDLISAARRDDIAILAGDINGRLDWFSSNEAYLGRPFGLDSCGLSPVGALYVPVASTLPGICLIRVTDGPNSIALPLVTYGGAVYKTAGRIGTLPSTPTTQQYAPNCVCASVGTQNTCCTIG